MKTKGFPPSLRKLMKRHARLVGQIAAHPSANDKAVQFFEQVMHATVRQAQGDWPDELNVADDDWPEFLEET